MQAILPALPTGRLVEEGYTPRLTDIGGRHPVTAGLSETAQEWGRWFRLIDLQPRSGHIVMEGARDKPLLILDRVDKGRIAILASDHAWLWSRGFEGGGPQLELLRRLAHWLMQEPQLEEEVLSAIANGKQVMVERRSLSDRAANITFTGPSGQQGGVALDEQSSGVWTAEFEATENGVYRISDGALETVVAIGPASPKEFEQPVGASPELLALVDKTGGGEFSLSNGAPDIRRTRIGRVAKGNGWAGLPRREAYTVKDIRLTPLAPGWLILMLVGLIALGAWRLEGK